ncbi:MAG: hypothetical protein U0470_07575 [Anaerolineae bacterium]
MTPPAAPAAPAAWSAAVRLAARLARSPDARALLALTAVCAAFFAPVLSGRYFLPRGGGDLASFLWPMYRFIAARLAAGDIPLWNPHQYAGAPLLADNQSGMLYPPFVAFWLLKPAFSYVDLERVVMGHTLFTGAAMYACLRCWGRGGNGGRGEREAGVGGDAGDGAVAGHGRGDGTGGARCFAPTAALVGAVAWMLNDVFITHLGNLNFNAAAGWLPLAVLGLHRACERPMGAEGRVGLRPAPTPHPGTGHMLAARLGLTSVATACLALGAVALGFGALAGHAQATFLCAAAVAAYALWRAAVGRDPWPLAALAIIGAFAFALAAPALLPALALRSSTVRATYDYATSVQYSLPPRALVGLVAPWWWGRGAAAFHGGWDRVEVGYVGVAPFVLAVVASAASARSAWRRRRAGMAGDRRSGEGGDRRVGGGRTRWSAPTGTGTSRSSVGWPSLAC